MKRVKKCFGLLPVLCIRACLLKMEAVVTVASHVTPAYILGLGPLKALIRPWEPHRCSGAPGQGASSLKQNAFGAFTPI